MESKATKIVQRLERLRDEGHLAMHMWEDDLGSILPAFETPRRTLSCLNFNEDTDARLIAQLSTNPPNHDLALLSMSLLPRFRGGVATSMLPFNTFDYCQGNAGYLVDMTPTAPSPPRAVVIASRDIFTSVDPIQKIDSVVRTAPVTCKLYHALPSGGPLDPKALSDFAQEGLSKLQQQNDEDLDNAYAKDNTISCNEIVVAARPEHMTAIMVPVFQSQEGKPRQWMAEAAGAIAGLRHGKDAVPVVAYHVDGAKQGGFTYWGASRKEFMGRLLDAVGKLEAAGIMDEKDKEDGALDALRDALSERGVLNYRVDAPKDVRLKQLEELKAGLNGASRLRT